MMIKRMDFTELNKTPPTIRLDSIIGGSPSAAGAAAIREHHNRTYSVTQNSVVFSRASSTDLPHSQTCPALPQRLRLRRLRRPKNLLTPPHPDFRKLLPWQEVTWNLCQLSDRNGIHLDSLLHALVLPPKTRNLLCKICKSSQVFVPGTERGAWTVCRVVVGLRRTYGL